MASNIKEYDSDPEQNSSLNTVNVANGSPPALINDASRVQMAHLKDFYDGDVPVTIWNIASSTNDNNVVSMDWEGDFFFLKINGVKFMRIDTGGNVSFVGTITARETL